MDINIFLASSDELKDDRKGFRDFINQLNETWKQRGFCFHLKMWEDFSDPMAEEGSQSVYNDEIKKCEMFVMLFFTKVGQYTAAEFETAVQQFLNNKKPRIHIYFKESSIPSGKIGDEIISMLEFKK